MIALFRARLAMTRSVMLRGNKLKMRFSFKEKMRGAQSTTPICKITHDACFHSMCSFISDSVNVLAVRALWLQFTTSNFGSTAFKDSLNSKGQVSHHFNPSRGK